MTPSGLAPSRRVLDNGVTVIAKANHTTPAVHLILGVAAGGFSDPPGAEGTAALAARVLDRGTESRPADAIADELDRRGASVSVTAGRHQIAIGATCLTEDFDAVLTLVADMARRPVFPAQEVATRRAELITSIRQEEDDPAAMAVDAMMRLLYGTHPYARKVRGSVTSVAGIGQPDLAAFHRTWFAPHGVTVVVVGDIIEAAAIDAVAATVGDWIAPWPGRPDVPEASSQTPRRIQSVPMMNKAQADVAYGVVGIRRSDPAFTIASVMNNALGQYAIGGRLGDSIRERQGMAYYVFSSMDAGFGQGPLMIRAGVSAENVERTIASIDAELNAVLHDGFTAKEVDESKRYLIGSLPRQLETNAAIGAFLLNAELFQLGLDYDVRLPAMLRNVTREAVAAVARRLLDPTRAAIAVAGPWRGDDQGRS